MRMIDDYRGDLSKVEHILSDSGCESGHHDGVTLAGPPSDSIVGEVGVQLKKTMVVGRLAMPRELNMELPSTSKDEAGRFLSGNPASKLSYVDIKKLEFKLGIPPSICELSSLLLAENSESNSSWTNIPSSGLGSISPLLVSVSVS
ncbi:hypothetical protein LWI29_002095 [Acer saccharum]|uniref:Uncharacterized protein n=1 Tax=Acer saccharum TaxID=4024 RepID=A0AA39VN10_ACESA|nr:hypothetical protein LWI29_002095 [Acer saccharum]